MLIISLIDTIWRYARYRSQLAGIDQLNERSLRDIGINRSKLAAAAWRMAGRSQYP